MSTINITLSKFDSEWDGSIGKAKRCSTSLNSASTIIRNVTNRLDQEILYYRNIHNDLNRVSRSIEEIEGRITDIRTFLINGAKQYLEAQKKISQLHKNYDLPYKKNTWANVGKAVKIGFSALGVIGAVGLLATVTGGVAVTFAFVGIAFAVNDFITTVNKEVYNKDINFLKSMFEGAGSGIGSFCGNENLGKNIGNFLYHGLNVTTAIYNLTKAVTKLSDPAVKAPKMITKIADSKVVKTIENFVTGITNKAIGVAKSSKGLSFIQNNLIMPIKKITSVGVNGVKSLLANPVKEIKMIIKPGTDFVVGVANKCKIWKETKIYKAIGNLKDLKSLTGAVSVSDNVGAMKFVHKISTGGLKILNSAKQSEKVGLIKVIYDLIPQQKWQTIERIIKEADVIQDGFTATSSLLKVDGANKKLYKDILTYGC